jgi:hypothetical protein
MTSTELGRGKALFLALLDGIRSRDEAARGCRAVCKAPDGLGGRSTYVRCGRRAEPGAERWFCREHRLKGWGANV